jgi:hypothetical protein
MKRRRPWPILHDVVLPGLAGVLAGLVAAAAMLVLDVGHLRSMILREPHGWVAVLLLAAGFMITFGSVAIGASVMGLGERDD